MFGTWDVWAGTREHGTWGRETRGRGTRGRGDAQTKNKFSA